MTQDKQLSYAFQARVVTREFFPLVTRLRVYELNSR